MGQLQSAITFGECTCLACEGMSPSFSGEEAKASSVCAELAESPLEMSVMGDGFDDGNEVGCAMASHVVGAVVSFPRKLASYWWMVGVEVSFPRKLASVLHFQCQHNPLQWIDARFLQTRSSHCRNHHGGAGIPARAWCNSVISFP